MALWIHENPPYKRTSFWNLVGLHQESIQFPAIMSGFSFSFCMAWQRRYALPTFSSHSRWFIFFVFRINKVYISHPSSIIEFWLLVYPLLLLPLLSGCPNFSLYFRPHMIWSRRRLSVCQSPPEPHISSWRLSTIVLNL